MRLGKCEVHSVFWRELYSSGQRLFWQFPPSSKHEAFGPVPSTFSLFQTYFFSSPFSSYSHSHHLTRPRFHSSGFFSYSVSLPCHSLSPTCHVPSLFAHAAPVQLICPSFLHSMKPTVASTVYIFLFQSISEDSS